jgi:uncharacterized protein YqgC (DUF456 family)
MVASPRFAPFTTNLFQGFQTVVQTIVQAVAAWFSQMGQAIAYGYTEFTQALVHITAPLATASPWLGVLYILLLLVMIVGIVGAFVPALPGITLIVGSVLVWGLAKGFAGLGTALAVAIVGLVLSIAIDYLAGIIGAQRVGASKWGQIGAVVGMLLGLFGFLPALPIGGPIFGIIFGTVLGAFVGEFLHRRELELPKRIKQSFRVGFAIVVGNLVGNLLQGVLAFFAFAVFLVTTWSTAFGG